MANESKLMRHFGSVGPWIKGKWRCIILSNCHYICHLDSISAPPVRAFAITTQFSPCIMDRLTEGLNSQDTNERKVAIIPLMTLPALFVNVGDVDSVPQ